MIVVIYTETISGSSFLWCPFFILISNKSYYRIWQWSNLRNIPSQMHQKWSAVKFFENFAGNHLCFNLVFNEDTGWKIFQNLQGNTCVVVSSLITLQAGVAIAPSNFWYTCIFSTALFITKSKVFATFMQSALTQVQQLLAFRQYHI